MGKTQLLKRHGGVQTMKALNFLVFQEGKHWVAQCVEHNIGVQADSLQEIHPGIRRRLWVAIWIRAHHELPGIEPLPAAPDQYRCAFDAAVVSEMKMEPRSWTFKGRRMPRGKHQIR